MTSSGIKDWLLQRFSAIYLAFYTVFFIYFYCATPEITYDVWQALFQSKCMQLATVIAFISIAIHGWIGLWTVATDYLKFTSVRMVFLALVLLTLMSYVIWSINILWSV